MSTKSANSKVVRQSAKELYTNNEVRDTTNKRTHAKTTIEKQKEPIEKKSVRKERKLMLTSWGSDNRQSTKEKDGRAMTINDAHLRSYLLDSRGLSPKNTETLIRNIMTIQRVWGITEPTEENALILKGLMREKSRSPNSIRQYLWAMRYWAMAYGKDISFKEVPLPKPIKTEPKILDFELVGKIIRDERFSIRDRVIMMIFAITACRNGELAAIKLTDIDHKERTILLRDTKTRKEEIAPIPSRYYPILTTYLEVRAQHLAKIGGKTDSLLIGLYTWKDKEGNTRYDLTDDGIRQVIYRIAERYGLDEPAVPGQRRKRKLHPHTMRHTATTKLMEILGNPEEVMKITGHSTSAMIDWYSHPRLERIKVKVEALNY